MEKVKIDDTFKPKVNTEITRRERIIRYFSPWKAIFFMCLPTVLIMVIMSTYSMIDKFLALQFAGQHIVDNYLVKLSSLQGLGNAELLIKARGIINAATQYSSTTVALITAISLFIALGTSTRFGIAYGSKNDELMKKNIGNGLALLILLSIVFTPVLIITNKPLIAIQQSFSSISNEFYDITLDTAVNYTKWYLFFLFFILLSNFAINLLRSEGQGFWAIIIILSSAVLNIVLDIIFMKVFKWGVEGAAIATVISWIWNIVFVGLIILLDSKTKLKIGFKDLKIDKKIMFSIIAIGMTPLFMNISIALTSALSNYFVTNLSGVLYKDNTAGVPWAINLFAAIAPWIALTDAPIIGVSQGGRALLSYSYGAKKYQRIWQILKRIFIIQLILLIVTEIIIAFFGSYMLRLFISDVDKNYRWYFLLSYMMYPAVVVPYIGMLFYQSISKPKMALFFSSLRSVLVFIPCVTIGYLLSYYTKSAMYYFLFMGLVAPISALISVPILIRTWKKYRNYLE